MNDASFREVVRWAVLRVEEELLPGSLHGRERFERWTRTLYKGNAVTYWLNPSGFPILQLPWWFAEASRAQISDNILRDITYSSMCGYLAVRLIDNAMDDPNAFERGLLPMTGPLHSRFQAVYHRLFDADAKFWTVFSAIWAASVEVTIRDRALTDVPEAAFQEVSARKLLGANIPVAAVAYLCDVQPAFNEWKAFVEALGGWYQRHNDFFDWHRDLVRGASTYVLTAAREQCAAGESVAGWFAREGIDWGAEILDRELASLRARALHYGSAGLADFLRTRAEILQMRLDAARKGASALTSISLAFGNGRPG